MAVYLSILLRGEELCSWWVLRILVNQNRTMQGSNYHARIRLSYKDPIIMQGSDYHARIRLSWRKIPQLKKILFAKHGSRNR